MADRENDNEPDPKRLKQDDENGNNVNDGNLQDGAGHDADVVDAYSDDGVDSASDSSEFNDEEDGFDRGTFHCSSYLVLDGNWITFESEIPINQERIGERVLRLSTNEIHDEWVNSQLNPTYHEGRVEVELENVISVSVRPRSGLAVNDVLLRKVDNGLEIEFPA